MSINHQEDERLKEARLFILKSNLQILDLKHLADLEADYKAKSQTAIKEFKVWKKKHHQQTDVIEITYGAIEGSMLKMRAQHAARLYWIIRGDLRDVMKRYIAGCTYCPDYQSKTAWAKTA